MGDNESKGLMTKEIKEIVETNMHGYIQDELVGLKECAPSKDDKKKYFKKNVGAYYKVVNETANTEQKIKAGGYGNATTNNLTVNLLNELGLSDKIKMRDELMEKLGYVKKEEIVGDSPVLREAKFSATAIPKNRINDDVK